jgi:hypothetical protein
LIHVSPEPVLVVVKLSAGDSRNRSEFLEVHDVVDHPVTDCLPLHLFSESMRQPLIFEFGVLPIMPEIFW